MSRLKHPRTGRYSLRCGRSLRRNVPKANDRVVGRCTIQEKHVPSTVMPVDSEDELALGPGRQIDWLSQDAATGADLGDVQGLAIHKQLQIDFRRITLREILHG